MMNLEEVNSEERKPRSVFTVITWIVLMNLVFSFDSILSAMALSDVFWVMAAAIVIGGLTNDLVSRSRIQFSTEKSYVRSAWAIYFICPWVSCCYQKVAIWRT